MKAKNRKPLTPEQRERKNAADRARRAKKKKAPASKPNPKPYKPKSKAGRPHGKPPMRKLSEKSGKFARPVKIRQHGITRPTPVDSENKPRKTFRVWQIADEISARTKKIATRAEVLKICKKERIAYSTFSNSFYQWRKFNGVCLRIRKDGTLSKPMGPGHGQKTKGNKKPRPSAKKPKPRVPTDVAKIIGPFSLETADKVPAPTGKPPVPAKPPLPVAAPSLPPFMAPPPV